MHKCRNAAMICAAISGLIALSTRGSSQGFGWASARLDQVNWFNQTGGVAQANSSWGRFSFTYDPDLTQTYYLNLSIGNSLSGAAHWAIQNAPLFFVDNGNSGTRSEMIEVDLSVLGMPTGTDITSLFAGFDLSTAPIGSAPSLTGMGTLEDFDWKAWDQPDELGPGTSFTDPGDAKGIKGGAAAAAKPKKRREMGEVQEADNHCFAGATARSIEWLDREHNFGIGKTAQQIYDDLVGLNVSKPNNDGSKARERWIKSKSDYAKDKSGNKIVTKSWDSGGWLDPIEGVAETDGGTSDFIDWFMAEWEHGEDIELIYNFPDGGHIVTVVDFYKQDGKWFVLYADDEEQGDNAKGDGKGGDKFPKVKRREIYKKDGKWRFGADKNEISWALSESKVNPVPEPGSVVALGLGALVLLRRKRQNR